MEPFLPLIHAILDADRDAPKKHKHTGKRIYDRLKNEHAFTGSLSSVYGIINAYKKNTPKFSFPSNALPGMRNSISVTRKRSSVVSSRKSPLAS